MPVRLRQKTGKTTLPGKKYRTAKEIVIPKGHRVVFAGRMRQDLLEMVAAVVPVGPDMHFDWLMARTDALEAGLIEEVSE